MRPGAAPLSEQLTIAATGPPIMAALWWLRSRGMARVVQGGSVSQRTKQRQKTGFLVLLGAMYLLALGILLYAALISS